MRAIIERHGGTVEKFVGDAVMAVFGVPRVREDDALRAVRAAVRSCAVPVPTDRARLRVRTGVNTGEVVIGEGETLATGDAVNVAARLEQAAAPGEILIGAATLRLVRDAVEVEPVEPLDGKGKPEPLPRSGCSRRPGARRPSRAGSTRRWSAGDASCAAARRFERSSRSAAATSSRCWAPPASASRGSSPSSSGAGRRRSSSRPLPSLRRGDHVLAAGRGAEAARRTARTSRPDASEPRAASQSRTSCSGGPAVARVACRSSGR